MEKDWVAVYSTGNAQSSLMVKAMLETNGIDTVEMDKQDSSYKIGRKELFVRRENAIKAKFLIDGESQ